MVDWAKCAKLRCHPIDYLTTKPWFQWIGGVPDVSGNTGLMALCREGAITVIRDVIHRYAYVCNPGHTNEDGNTALMLLCERNYAAARSMDSTDESITLTCQLFARFGAACAPGLANDDGDTALMLACRRKKFTLTVAVPRWHSSKPLAGCFKKASVGHAPTARALLQYGFPGTACRTAGGDPRRFRRFLCGNVAFVLPREPSSRVRANGAPCHPEKLYKVVRGSATSWAPVALQVLAKLLELDCADFPKRILTASAKVCVMELAIAKDAVRLFDVHRPL